MTVFLNEVLDGEFGGVRQYFKDYCGFTDEDLDKIRANLVVEGGEVVCPPPGWKTDGQSEGEGKPMGLATDRDGGREDKVMAG